MLNIALDGLIHETWRRCCSVWEKTVYSYNPLLITISSMSPKYQIRRPDGFYGGRTGRFRALRGGNFLRAANYRLQDHDQFLYKIINEAKARQSTKSVVLGKAKVLFSTCSGVMRTAIGLTATSLDY